MTCGVHGGTVDPVLHVRLHMTGYGVVKLHRWVACLMAVSLVQCSLLFVSQSYLSQQPGFGSGPGAVPLGDGVSEITESVLGLLATILGYVLGKHPSVCRQVCIVCVCCVFVVKTLSGVCAVF